MISLHCLALSCLLAAVPLDRAHGAEAPTTSRDLAAACAACHDTEGRSKGVMPRLAGRPPAELVRALRDFRDGARAGTVMPQLAKAYRDDEIDALAAWFAAQRR